MVSVTPSLSARANIASGSDERDGGDWTQCRHAGVTRGADDAVDAGFPRQPAGQGVLACAGAKDEDVHCKILTNRWLPTADLGLLTLDQELQRDGADGNLRNS